MNDKSEAQTGTADPANSPAAVAPKELDLSSGEALTRSETDAIAKVAPTIVVGVIGLTGAGKTTFIASIYDLLLDNPIRSFAFARSRTLFGFERLCHLARVGSGRLEPDTEHTSLSVGLRYYHLGVRNSSSGNVELLFADRAGESFLHSATNLGDMKDLDDLRCCQKILYLVDGQQYLDPALRFDVEAKCGLILQALAESHTIDRGCQVAIALTKFDLVAADLRDDVLHRFAEFVTRLSKRDQLAGFGLSGHVVAARSTAADIPSGHGIANLFTDFIVSQSTLPPEPRPSEQLSRMFHRIRGDRIGG